MLNKQYNFSGVSIAVYSEQDMKVKDTVKQFEELSVKADFSVEVSFSENLPESSCAESAYLCNKRNAGEAETPYAYIEYTDRTCRVTVLDIYSENFDMSTVLRTMQFYHAMLKFDAVILHASYIIADGKAILFSAPSETGKSTQAELWKKYRGARIINGDRVLVRCTQEGFTAGGIYYSGTSEYCENVTAPVEAIVLLGQAKENCAEKCGGGEAFRRLFRECTCTSIFKEDTTDVAEILAKVVNNVRIIKFNCLPDESAVIALEEYLREGENEWNLNMWNQE